MVGLGLGAPAFADVLYGTRGGQLFTIDTDTLEGELVGGLGVASVSGLVFGPDGTLYGLASDGSLVMVSTSTGSTLPVGALGAVTSSSSGLGFVPSTGQMYAATAETGFAGSLSSISMATGLATPIGATGASALVGLDGDDTGILWGIDGGPGAEELVRIDTGTGLASVVKPNGLAAFPAIGCLDRASDGALWAVNRTPQAYELVRVDPASGTGTLVGPIAGISVSGAMTGLASYEAQAAGFQVLPPVPGPLNKLLIQVTGAPPGEPIVFRAAYQQGSGKAPGCPGLLMDVQPPYAFSKGLKTSTGDVGFLTTAPPALAGTTLYFQAVATKSCQKTAVVSYTF